VTAQPTRSAEEIRRLLVQQALRPGKMGRKYCQYDD